MTRIYVPANAAMLRTLADTGEVKPVSAVHTVTAWLRREAPGADIDDLEYTAFADAAAASVALLIDGSQAAPRVLIDGSQASPKGLPGQPTRRVVISADVPDDRVTQHREGTGADFNGSVKLKKVAAVHVDDAEAAEAIAGELAADAPDLEAIEANVLDWYAPSELQDLLRSLA